MIRNIKLLKPLPHHPIQFRGLTTSIDNHNRELQTLFLSQELLDHRTPTIPNPGRDLGESISGQIHEDPSVIYIKEVNQLGTAWSGTGSGQTLFPEQTVDQAGFSNIRSSRERDSGKPQLGIIILVSRTLDELNFHVPKTTDHKPQTTVYRLLSFKNSGSYGLPFCLEILL